MFYDTTFVWTGRVSGIQNFEYVMYLFCYIPVVALIVRPSCWTMNHYSFLLCVIVQPGKQLFTQYNRKSDEPLLLLCNTVYCRLLLDIYLQYYNWHYIQVSVTMLLIKNMRQLFGLSSPLQWVFRRWSIIKNIHVSTLKLNSSLSMTYKKI